MSAAFCLLHQQQPPFESTSSSKAGSGLQNSLAGQYMHTAQVPLETTLLQQNNISSTVLIFRVSFKIPSQCIHFFPKSQTNSLTTFDLDSFLSPPPLQIITIILRSSVYQPCSSQARLKIHTICCLHCTQRPLNLWRGRMCIMCNAVFNVIDGNHKIPLRLLPAIQQMFSFKLKSLL